jgi:dolichol-phosphate mannosyltransferase
MIERNHTIAARGRPGAFAHAHRFSRFALVGAAGVLVNNGLLAFLVEVGGLRHLVAALLATEAAIIGNFALNDRWTFRDRRGAAPSLGAQVRRAGRYNAVALGGMALSLSMIAALTGWWGLHYLVANLCAIATATLWNYVVNARFTWALPAPAVRATPQRPGKAVVAPREHLGRKKGG